MTRKIIGYRRVSTSRQGTSGLGLEAQEAAISAYSRTCDGTIIASYTEVESGKRSDRPQLALALTHAKRAKATLVIAKLDRLARNVHFLSGLMESRVDFVCVDNPTANRLTLHILAAVAEDEARRISERTKAALAAYKARGGTLGTDNLTDAGRALGWLRSVEARKANVDARYAELLPQVQGLRDEGLSLRAIADRLNAENIPTHRGAAWTSVQVHRVLGRAAN
jgi:DNA invertase Pin-like site-specific DNA recombinase